METWKKVQGYEAYEVSTCGNVRNSRTGKMLKASINGCGYRLVTLGYGNSKTVSRLVASAFLDKPDGERLEVAHNDGTRTNDNVTNLRWATKTENQRDRYRHGTHSIGEKCGSAKLTNEQAEHIRNTFVKKHGVVAALARKYGLSNYAMWKICHGISYAKEAA